MFLYFKRREKQFWVIPFPTITLIAKKWITCHTVFFRWNSWCLIVISLVGKVLKYLYSICCFYNCCKTLIVKICTLGRPMNKLLIHQSHTQISLQVLETVGDLGTTLLMHSRQQLYPIPLCKMHSRKNIETVHASRIIPKIRSRSLKNQILAITNHE